MSSVSVYVRRHHLALIALLFAIGGGALALQEDAAESPQAASVPRTTVTGDGGSAAALELEGAEGIDSIARAAWDRAPSEARLRVSRATPDYHGARHFLITPYQYGMAIEYDGMVEAWVKDFSIHGPGHGVAGAHLWVGNDNDTGGILLRARKRGKDVWGEIATQRFGFYGGGLGPLRLRTVMKNDWVEVWSGTAAAARRQVMLGTIGPSSAAGIKFGARGDSSVYRPAPNVVKTDDKLITGTGLGVGNSAPAQALGRVAKKMEVFDATGSSLGYVPIYEAIR